MPFLFFLLGIIVLLSGLCDSDKVQTRRQADYSASIRKTNEELEFQKTREYFLAGDNLDTAMEKSIQFMLSQGYDAPCIPKNRYWVSCGDLTMRVGLPCDSMLVQFKQSDFDMMNGYPKFSRSEEREEYQRKRQEYIYAEPFPKTATQYENWLTYHTYITGKYRVPGSYIYHPEYGTCKIKDNIFVCYHKFHTYGWYVVTIQKTGEEKQIPMNDKTIREISGC